MSREPAGPVLAAQGIDKLFPGAKVLDQVHFEVRPGEIMGLVGENGAGKSTLMKILTGIYQPNAGTILYRGKPVSFQNAKEAQKAGISMIHQEFNLFPNQCQQVKGKISNLTSD